MKIIFASCLLYMLFLCQNLVAQELKNKESISDSSYWQAGLTYQNDNIYLGRKDSLRVPYLTPSIGYYHKSGIFVEGALSLLAASYSQRIDLVTLDGGYRYANDNLEAEITGTKYFYNSNSTSVKSEVKGSIDALVSYDFGIIRPSFEITDNFSSHSDINLTLGIEHTFFPGDSNFDITPTAFANVGTQNYYSSYFNKKSYASLRKKKNGNGMNYYSISATVTDASKLKLLDYELAVPVNYVYNKFTFNFTPSYALPTNPATLVVTIKSAARTEYAATNRENLSNNFYFTTGITYSFP